MAVPLREGGGRGVKGLPLRKEKTFIYFLKNFQLPLNSRWEGGHYTAIKKIIYFYFCGLRKKYLSRNVY